MTTEFLAESAGMLDYDSDEEEKSAGFFKSIKILPNGDKFEGVRDLLSGEIVYGTYRSAATKELYIGPFLKGMRHGNGAVCFQRNGGKFIGRYRKNQPQKGTWIEREFTYTGTFYVNEEEKYRTKPSILNPSCFHGYGKLFLRDGNIYEGEFNQGKYSGVGKEILPDGSRYTGEFKNGERQGLGTFISSDGTCQSGVWVHDQMVNSHVEGLVILQPNSLEFEEKKVDKPDPATSFTYDDFFNDNKSNFDYTHSSKVKKKASPTRKKNSNSSVSASDAVRTSTITTEEYTYTGQHKKNNIFHGCGSLTLNSTEESYEGEFVNGLYQGTGKLTLKDSTIYTGDFYQNKKHGVGTLVEPSGRCYSGDFKEDLFDGEGIETLPDGELYTGQFSKGQRHGKASVTYQGIVMEGAWEKGFPVHLYEWSVSYPDGNKYVGHLLRKKPHGLGTMTYSDHSVYTGHWYKGKKNGNGEFKDAQGLSKQGIWENDIFKEETKKTECAIPSSSQSDSNTLRNRFKTSSSAKDTIIEISSTSSATNSVHKYDNGDIYTGHIDTQGLRQGHGKFITTNTQYEGNFSDSKKSGQGVFITNNTHYTGSFLNDDFDGEGTLYYHKSSASYQGKFSKGKYHGKGVYTSKNGDIYEGDFQCGYKHGIGKEIYQADGLIYRGEFKDDKKNGIGTLQQKADSRVLYSGGWKDDLMHGDGVLFMEPKPNNNQLVVYAQKYEGEFEAGQKCGSGALTLSDGTILSGRWCQDVPSEYGSWMITYCDGTVYSGSVKFSDDPAHIIPQPNDFGTMHYINGDFYTGNFKDGYRHGKGLCLFDNGESLDGNWVKDEFVS